MASSRSNTSEPTPEPSPETWPQKLNKALIAIGVIAFGLIVTDRLLEAFRADDAPAEVASIEQQTSEVTAVASDVQDNAEQVLESAAVDPESQTAAQSTSQVVNDTAAASGVSDTAVQSMVTAAASPTDSSAENLVNAQSTDERVSSELDDEEVLVQLENLFGSRVVFVSASEPVYVVTQDERRFDVGSTVNEETTLAGVTAQQLILEKSGDLMVISLPDPTVQ